tara:strand:- start:4141 stop:4458 length:318 start_codon:yes stop_codon:yes gene_type:complete
MEASTLAALLGAISGPAAATVVMFLVLAGFAWLFVKHLLPLAEKLIKDSNERHDSLIERLMTEHKEDRDLFGKALAQISSELKKLAVGVNLNSERIKDLEEKANK